MVRFESASSKSKEKTSGLKPEWTGIILCAFHCKVSCDESCGCGLLPKEPFFKYIHFMGAGRRKLDIVSIVQEGFWQEQRWHPAVQKSIPDCCFSAGFFDLLISLLSSLCLIWTNPKRQENLPTYLTVGIETPSVPRSKSDNSGWGRGESCSCCYGQTG